MKGTKPESPQACAWSGGTRASVSSERIAIFRIDPSGKVLVAKGEKGTWVSTPTGVSITAQHCKHADLVDVFSSCVQRRIKAQNLESE